LAGSLEVPVIGEFNKTADPKIVAAIRRLNELLGGENKVAPAGLEAAARPLTWYTPKIIEGENSTSSTSFTTLTTADEIPGVVLPENGLLVIGYSGYVSSSAGNGRASIFLGANQLRIQTITGLAQDEPVISGPGFVRMATTAYGMKLGEGGGPDVTTGEILASKAGTYGGMMTVFAAAGTYSLSVRYKALASETVKAKERKLWAYTLG
jgi:hypothetical protein